MTSDPRLRPAATHEHLLVGAAVCLAAVGGALAGAGEYRFATLAAAPPLAWLAGRRFIRSSPAWLVSVLFVVGAVGYSDTALISSPAHVYISDVGVLGLALHLILSSQRRPDRSRYPWGGVMFWSVLFLSTLTAGSFEGHSRNAASLISSPARLGAYALIAFTVLHTPLPDLMQKIRLCLYAVAVAGALFGVFLLASGRAATASAALDTGGQRILPGSLALYVGSAALLAALDLGRSDSRRTTLCAGIALAASCIVEVLALNRATLFPLVVLLPLFLLLEGRNRTKIVSGIAIAVLAIGVAAASFDVAAPAPVSALEQRLTGSSLSNGDVLSREEATDAVLQGFGPYLIFGRGFGYQPYFVSNETVVQVDGGDPHDGFVFLLVGGGLVCLVAFVGMLLAVTARYFGAIVATNGETRTALVWGFGALCIYVVNIGLGPIISQAQLVPPLWVLAALPVAALSQDTKTRKLGEALGADRATGVR